jgi:hypothetical protein
MTAQTPDSITDATVDRVLIAAVDHLLSAGTEPSGDPGPSDLVVADAQAIVDVLDAVTIESPLGESLFGGAVVERVAERLYRWASGAVVRIDRSTSMPTTPLPAVARHDQVARAWAEAWRLVQDEPASSSSRADDDDPWSRLLAMGLTPADLLWAAASLVTCLIHRREELPDAHRGMVVPVLDELARSLPGGNLAWAHPAGARVARPERHRLRAFFDGGSGVLLWIGLDVGEPRWGNDVDHRDLPIPIALADQIDRLLERYDSTIPIRGPERPLEGAEARLFRAAYAEVVDRLRAALGPAYLIVDQSRTSDQPGG